MEIKELKKKQKVFFIALEYYSEKYIVEEGKVSKIYLQNKKGYVVTDDLGSEWFFPLIPNNVMFLTKEKAQKECDRRNNETKDNLSR